MKISFCIHNHQPVGNFHHVMESAFRGCYLPMLEVLESHVGVRTGLHISGTLLQWLEENQTDYLRRIADLCKGNRMELLASGRYEPILPVFKPSDIRQQIVEYRKHLQTLSGKLPSGLWLTERVWEPGLTSIIADAGISYAVVDDIHLQRGGIGGMDIFRPCITEDSGRTLRLLGSSRDLRYRIPFSSVDDILSRLAELDSAGAEVVFYGDDGEKFGVWPGTHQLCYERGWLDDFFTCIENTPWLETILPSEAARADPVGPVYIPTCSYSEMGEWTLSGSSRRDYIDVRREALVNHSQPQVDTIVPGGFWRNFLSRYPESKELHGRILSAEDDVRESGSEKALHHLWRSQCNCAFWHGVFGGIYLPHLREAVWKELQLAEIETLRNTGELTFIRDADVDADGWDETLYLSNRVSLLVHPGKGLTLSEMSIYDVEGQPVPLGHVLTRRPEEYHDNIPGGVTGEDVSSIHGDLPSKEDGLAERVIIDRWRRMILTDITMPDSIDFRQWMFCSDEIRSMQVSPSDYSRRCHEGIVSFKGLYENHGWSCQKKLEIQADGSRLEAKSVYATSPGWRTGLEVCVNLMTGSLKDRVFSVDGGESHQMGESGACRGKLIRITDIWRGVFMELLLGEASDIWYTPIESVNRSESGYESVHQGTAFYLSGIADKKGCSRMGLGIEMGCLDDS